MLRSFQNNCKLVIYPFVVKQSTSILEVSADKKQKYKENKVKIIMEIIHRYYIHSN